jgi:hypothetical protein
MGWLDGWAGGWSGRWKDGWNWRGQTYLFPAGSSEEVVVVDQENRNLGYSGGR